MKKLEDISLETRLWSYTARERCWLPH